MSKKKKGRGRPKHTARIYYCANPASADALYWKVRVKHATQRVVINGGLLDALKGERGTTIGCHLSNCSMRNAEHFPHPCLLVSFTNATALIVTKIARGKPAEAVLYHHSYSGLIDLNDADITKKFVKDHPDIAARKFTLRPPQKPRVRAPLGAQIHRNGDGTKRAVVPKGALRRAVQSGLVSPGLLALAA
jgi:hypothetical protein